MARGKMGSNKRALITKANKRIVIYTAVAAFVLVFTVVAANTLVRQLMYQNRVIGARKDALKVAEDSLAASEDLRVSYQSFINRPQNLLGGNPTGNGDSDGDNAKIVLDALPSRYDFPALATTIEKLVTGRQLEFVSITGIDDTIAQQANQSSASPQPIEIPFEFSVRGSYGSIRGLVEDLERSIRPFQVVAQDVTADGNSGDVTMRLSAKTFFQPEKNLNVTKEVVK